VRPYLKKTPSQKRAGGVAQGVGPEFKPQYHKKKKVKWSGKYRQEQVVAKVFAPITKQPFMQIKDCVCVCTNHRPSAEPPGEVLLLWPDENSCRVCRAL
jgi:hypothetical protein